MVLLKNVSSVFSSVAVCCLLCPLSSRRLLPLEMRAQSGAKARYRVPIGSSQADNWSGLALELLLASSRN